MHISHTGVLDAAAYGPAEESTQESPTAWADLAVVVPLTVLYALVTLLTAVATAASGAGVSWIPLG